MAVPLHLPPAAGTLLGRSQLIAPPLGFELHLLSSCFYRRQPHDRVAFKLTFRQEIAKDEQVTGIFSFMQNIKCGRVVVILQEALGSFGQPSKLRRVALDFSSPQLSPQRGAARTGTPPAAAAGLRSPPLDGRTGSGVGTAASGGGGDSPGLGQSLRSPSGQFRRSSLLGAISSSIRYQRASHPSHNRPRTSEEQQGPACNLLVISCTCSFWCPVTLHVISHTLLND